MYGLDSNNGHLLKIQMSQQNIITIQLSVIYSNLGQSGWPTDSQYLL